MTMRVNRGRRMRYDRRRAGWNLGMVKVGAMAIRSGRDERRFDTDLVKCFQ